MAEPWKWGFTPGERRALLFIGAAILAGVSFQSWQRQGAPSTLSLTREDSLGLAAIAVTAKSDSSEILSRKDLPPDLLDLNLATGEQIETLPGVGPVLAKRIIAWRDSLGGFKKTDDLMAVPGIGSKRLAKLRPLITLSAP